MTTSLNTAVKIIGNKHQVAIKVWEREIAALNGERPSRKHMIECLKTEGMSEDMAKVLYHHVAYVHRN